MACDSDALYVLKTISDVSRMLLKSQRAMLALRDAISFGFSNLPASYLPDGCLDCISSHVFGVRQANDQAALQLLESVMTDMLRN
jgi:hypothetical protein